MSEFREQKLLTHPSVRLVTRHENPEDVGLPFQFLVQDVGVIAIRPQNSDLHPRRFLASILAATGMANKEIAKAMLIKKATVDSHLKNVRDTTGVRHRRALPRFFMAHRVLNIVQPCEPFTATPTESEVLQEASFGHQNTVIARATQRSPGTVHSHLKCTSGKMGGNVDTPTLIFATFASGQLDFDAPPRRNPLVQDDESIAEPKTPWDWYLATFLPPDDLARLTTDKPSTT